MLNAFGVFYLDDIVSTENTTCVSSVPVLPNCALHLWPKKQPNTHHTQPKQTGVWNSPELQVFLFVPLPQQIETLYHPRPGRSKLCPDWCSGTSGMGWHLCVQITGFKCNEKQEQHLGAVLWERLSPCCPPSSLSMPLMSLWRCPYALMPISLSSSWPISANTSRVI